MKFIALFTASVLSFPFPFPGMDYMKSGSGLQHSNQGSHHRYMNSGAEPSYYFCSPRHPEFPDCLNY
ncbi:hypothetical protein CONCODRAFT_78319 [Conidiobolus coronatus NRRL 28638]|uniref:Uncharacterized protein n=1 Tax=Conidiobolus coronatus (strain ATCC 28846 / CBS 209.66 / NRRL 28638) TaxID=796925 RepID=A0A137P909_CONC2|nr:hypothetical protein CONCODRAFT_78319 [Conidiobolus coronatus NRRL 28638]|eukprot:KXN71497.1 hypothetical protein CONCODRAFT_78319 [Conidiobolus coronatus NRRL 28638]